MRLDLHAEDAAREAASNRLFQLPSFAPRVAGFRRAPVHIKDLRKERFGGLTLSNTMYLLIIFTKSNPPQNRQLDILISNSKQ